MCDTTCAWIPFPSPCPSSAPSPSPFPSPSPSPVLLVHLLSIGVCIHTDIVMIEKPDPAPLPQALSIPGQSRDKRSSHIHCVSFVRVLWYSLVTWIIPGQFSNERALPRCEPIDPVSWDTCYAQTIPGQSSKERSRQPFDPVS